MKDAGKLLEKKHICTYRGHFNERELVLVSVARLGLELIRQEGQLREFHNFTIPVVNVEDVRLTTLNFLDLGAIPLSVSSKLGGTNVICKREGVCDDH